jgi:hypothetical protein
MKQDEEAEVEASRPERDTHVGHGDVALSSRTTKSQMS